jgi:phytoene dehydrogenase-like protein
MSSASRSGGRTYVIGAGLGGLAVALRLQALGFEVTVLERRSTPGGRASQLRTGAFTWDTGPSLIMMPWLLEDTFAAAGLSLHDELTLRRLEPLYRIRWAQDERHLDFHSERSLLRREVERFSARDARAAVDRGPSARDPRRPPPADSGSDGTRRRSTVTCVAVRCSSCDSVIATTPAA